MLRSDRWLLSISQTGFLRRLFADGLRGCRRLVPMPLLNWSALRESNSRHLVKSQVHSHYAKSGVSGLPVIAISSGSKKR